MALWIPLLCCVSALLLVRRAFAVVTIEGESMAPTLVHGERILIYRWWPHQRLRKGQVVLLQPGYPLSFLPSLQRLPADAYVKRIVGMGGENIVTSLHELHKAHQAEQKEYYDEQGNRRWSIPEGYVFVCGDNLSGSIDSRIWGPLPQRNVLGVAIMKLQRQDFFGH